MRHWQRPLAAAPRYAVSLNFTVTCFFANLEILSPATGWTRLDGNCIVNKLNGDFLEIVTEILE